MIGTRSHRITPFVPRSRPYGTLAVFPSAPAPSPIVFAADMNAVICFDVPFKGVELDGDDGWICMQSPGRDDAGSSLHHFYFYPIGLAHDFPFPR